MRINVKVSINRSEYVLAGSLVYNDMIYVIIDNKYLIYYTRPIRRGYNKRLSWLYEVIAHPGNIQNHFGHQNTKNPLGISLINEDFKKKYKYTEYYLSRYQVMYLLLMTKHPEYAKNYINRV